MIEIYTDGSCLGNPGPGGWAYQVIGGKSDSGGIKHATNNEAEMYAVLHALSGISDSSDVRIFTDSEMVIKWLGLNYSIKTNPHIKDIRDAIQLLCISKSLRVVFRKVKGHSDDQMNKKVDALARRAARLASEGIF